MLQVEAVEVHKTKYSAHVDSTVFMWPTDLKTCFSSIVGQVLANLESDFWSQPILVLYDESWPYPNVGLESLTPRLRDRHLNHLVTTSP